MPELFVYGTLTLPSVRGRLIGKREFVPCFLSGFRRVKLPIKYYGIVRSKGRVKGGILRVSSSDLRVLDKYEQGYTRQRVDCDGRRVWVYVPR